MTAKPPCHICPWALRCACETGALHEGGHGPAKVPLAQQEVSGDVQERGAWRAGSQWDTGPTMLGKGVGGAD